MKNESFFKRVGVHLMQVFIIGAQFVHFFLFSLLFINLYGPLQDGDLT